MRSPPQSAIGLRRKLFLRDPLLGLSLDCHRPLSTDSKWGCISDSLRYGRKHSATGVLLHLSRDRGGDFGRVTKSIDGANKRLDVYDPTGRVWAQTGEASLLTVGVFCLQLSVSHTVCLGAYWMQKSLSCKCQNAPKHSRKQTRSTVSRKLATVSRVRKKGSFGKEVFSESGHFPEILENLEILEIQEIQEIPPAKRPLS